jgi:ATP-dependent phosphofructokinase / diphosphate-dependent phosphofructokinase
MAKLKGNLVVAQSGGPTAVINASLAGVAQEGLKYSDVITGVYGALHGIEGVLYEQLVDLGKEPGRTLDLLRVTPSSALGSCRHKVTPADYDRILSVFKAHNIRYFFYIGGNDSMDTAHRVGQLAQEAGYDLACMGAPKTIDNDLDFTDHCPGYGSVARWIASSVRDAGLDTEAIGVVDKVKVVEIMGRNAGWITAASALARDHADAAPHLVYLPERAIIMDRLLNDVQKVYDRLGYVVITVCEGAKGPNGQSLSASTKAIDLDPFGHAQMGGVADLLCREISANLKLKARFDKPGTIQRTSIVLASKTDQDEAYLTGQMAVRHALEGVTDKMVTLVRESTEPYRCTTGLADLDKVANAEKIMPKEFINEVGNDVTEAFVAYARPLIGGPLPEYGYLQKVMLPKMLGN